MKEVKYIVNVVAILAIVTAFISFFASVYYDYINDIQTSVIALQFFGAMFFIAFFLGIIGITTDD